MKEKIGRVFIDVFGKPWVLRSAEYDRVCIESGPQIKTVHASIFALQYLEMDSQEETGANP